MHRIAMFFVFVCAVTAWTAVGDAATPADILKQTQVDKGLIVYVGHPTAADAATLTRGGENLVHVIVKTEPEAHALRQAIAQSDASGFVTVDAIEKIERLPFAGSFVNGVYIDKKYWGDAGPSDEDIQRVLVPDGISYDGASTWKKPWPEGMDDWTHFHYDSTNNPVSKDAFDPPMTSLKWIKWFHNAGGERSHLKGFGGTAGSRRSGYRTTEGNLYYSRWYRLGFAGERKGTPDWYDLSMDAFNGTPKWKKLAVTNRDRRSVTADGKIYTWAPVANAPKRRGGPAPEVGVMIDLETGEKTEMPNILPTTDRINPEANYLLYNGGRLFTIYGKTIRELHPKTGEIVWEYNHPYEGEDYFSPAFIPETNRIYVALTARGKVGTFRVTKTRNRRVLAIDADPNAKGDRLKWMNEEFIHGPGEFDPKDEVKGTKGNGLPTVAQPMIAQVLYADGLVVLFGAANQGPGPFLGSIDDNTGKLLWTGNYHEDDKIKRGWSQRNTYWPRRTDGKAMEGRFDYWARHAFIKDGVVYAATSYGARAYDIRTGKRVRAKDIAPRVPNQRCNSPRATEKYFVTGMTLFVKLDQPDQILYQQNTRSACGTGSFPAYNMLFYSESTCACFVMLRGEQGYGPLEKLQLIPNADRLATPAGLAASPLAGASPRIGLDDGQAAVEDSYKHPGRQKHHPDHSRSMPARKYEPQKNLLVDEWVNNSYLPRSSTPVVKHDGYTLRGWVHEHIIEAKKGDAVAWRFVTGGRISRPPAVAEGKVYVGCHDGYVYCLDLATGELQWKFLAALDHRKVAAYGQLESAWPVYGVLHHEGKIYLTAGRHPDVDGGIVAWSLDAKTGEPIWNKRVKSDMVWRKKSAEERRTWLTRDKFANGVINDVVKIKDGKLVIPNYQMDLTGTLSEIKQLDDAVERISKVE